MNTVLQTLDEIRIALRGLSRRPLTALAAWITLSLGFAAVLTIYTVLDSVVLEPLPYPQAERLVDVYSAVPGLGFDRWEVTEAGYVHFTENSRTLDALGAYRVGSMTLETDSGAERVGAVRATPSLFATLGAQTVAGRAFRDEDVAPGAPLAVVLGHGLWSRHYGADPDIVGRSITVHGSRLNVIGVLAAGFDLPEDKADLWLPLAVDQTDPDADSHSVRVIARRRGDADLAAVQAELDQLTAQFPNRFPGEYSQEFMRASDFHTVVQKLHAKVVGSEVRQALWILMGAAALVLLIAGANVTNLFLARNLDRGHEMALRQVLGARLGSVIRLFLLEGLIVGAAASAAAVVLGEFAIEGLKRLGPQALPRLADVELDVSSVGASVGLALLTAVLLGMLAVASTRRSEVISRLASAGPRATVGRAHRAVRGLLVVGQIALAIVLLNFSGLLLRSFEQLVQVDPGFEAEGVVAVDLPLVAQRYRDQESISAFYGEVLERVRSLPGVASAGAVSSLPLEPGLGCYSLAVEAHPPAGDEPPPCIEVYVATPGYFETLGVDRAAGRWFSTTDNTARTGALVVTSSLATRLWPNRDPLGQGASIHGYREPWFRVVGVTGPLLSEGLDQPPADAVYFPMVSPDGARAFLGHRSGMTLVARSTLDDPLQQVAGIRGAVAQIDPSVAVARPRLVRSVVAAARANTTLAAVLLTIASAISLVLTVVGLYAVLSQVITSRTREIGIRLALGADHAGVLRLVVAASARLVVAGLAAGVLASWATSDLVEGLLFGVPTMDQLTVAAVSALLVLVTALATVRPALRAVSVEPATALRTE